MASINEVGLNAISAVRGIEDTFIKQLESTLRALERRLTDFLDANKGIAAADVALARGQIEQILLDSGYFKVTGDLLNEGYQGAIEESFNLYQQLDESFQLGQTSLQQLNALKQLDAEEFNRLGSKFVSDLNRTLTDLQFGGTTFKNAVETLRIKSDVLGNHAKTWVTTGMSGIHRQANVAMAEDNGIDKFQYVGPLDSKTREFCSRHLGEVKTKAEWDALNDEQGQIAPVSQFAGGFNCRHQLVGVV